MFVSKKIGEYKKTHHINIIDLNRFDKIMEDKRNRVVDAGLGITYVIHISNIYNREEFRQKSLLSPNCKAVICGLGLDSYKAALSTLKN